MGDDAASEENERENWSSRLAYIVATIGGAIGFGNIWRFPSLAFQYGGGAFFVPYLLALFVIGIPLLILECTIGQIYQTGDAGAFGRVHKRFRGVGLASVSCSFVVVSYYSVLLAWVFRMFVYSCSNNAGWRGGRGKDGYDWFLENVTGLVPIGGESEGFDPYPSHLVGWNVLALAIVWLLIFLALAFGVRWSGRITYITVGLPVLFLFVILGRAVSLDGASDGVYEYIGKWEFNELRKQGNVWSEAVTQIFFSIGVTFGYITAFASYNQRNSPVFSNALIISLSNSFYSFVAGFAVFGAVGYLAKQEGSGIEDLDVGGPGLVFGSLPAVLSTLPGSGHWERLFFITLIFLGIDSAFALTEAVVTVFHDSFLFRRLPKAIVVFGVCTAGFLVGLLFCTNTGFFFLDSVDWYINFMLLLVGFFETFAVGWVYAADSQIEIVGLLPVLTLTALEFIPIGVASCIWFSIRQKFDSEVPAGWSSGDWALLWGFVGLVITFLVLLIPLVIAVMKFRANSTDGKKLSTRSYLVALLMGNVLTLRDELIPIVKYIPLIWFFMIRHVVPQLLLILFANLASSYNPEDDTSKKIRRENTFGNYGGYPAVYQIIGGICVASAGLIILGGLLFPDLYRCFDVSGVSDTEYKNKSSAGRVRVGNLLQKDEETNP